MSFCENAYGWVEEKPKRDFLCFPVVVSIFIQITFFDDSKIHE